MTLRQKNAQQKEELCLIDWYIQFMERGYDVRKIAKDYDQALNTIEELKQEIAGNQKSF